MELFARKCTVTGKGFSNGFIVGDDYAIDQKSADVLAIQCGYASYLEAHQEDESFAYWTEWGDEYIDEFDGGYTADGTQVFVTKTSIIETIIENLTKSISYIQKQIEERGLYHKFDTDLYDLYDSDCAEEGFEFWNQEDLDNHIYDLGSYYATVASLTNIKGIFENYQIQNEQ